MFINLIIIIYYNLNLKAAIFVFVSTQNKSPNASLSSGLLSAQNPKGSFLIFV